MLYLGKTMITQTLKINKSQFEAIKKLVTLFQYLYEPKYDNVLYEFKILKMPIFFREKKIGEEVVQGVIHFHEFENSMYLEMIHQSYFD